MPGFCVTVIQEGADLMVAFPGAPAGFEVPLVAQGSHSFLIESGPVKGAVATFSVDGSGIASSVAVGENVLLRDDEPSMDEGAEGHGLLAPPMLIDDVKRAAFMQLYRQQVEGGTGDEINYQLPYPKQEFLRFLAGLDSLIFHGSGDPDIELFQPVRTSLELYDHTGRGNRGAVYGTHDALWPMFFAVIDREQLTGSIRNGVDYFENRAGEQVTLYHFSINREMLAERPFRKGTLYLLPRETFQRLERTEGVYANEWASEEPVTPLARLALDPDDFPFLDQIGGHDDALLIRFTQLGDKIIASAVEAVALKAGFSMRLTWGDELAKEMMSYVGLVRQFLPQVTVELRFEANGGDTWLKLVGPPAFRHVLEKRLERILTEN
jgi:hypothetical protein